jgi:hypothetical protein
MSNDEIATLSRSANEEWFEIEPEMTQAYPTVRTKLEHDENPPDHSVMFNSRIIFSIPGDHAIMEMRLSDDFIIHGDEGGKVSAYLRLDPKWFAPNYEIFDYDLILYTAVGEFRKQGQIRVR